MTRADAGRTAREPSPLRVLLISGAFVLVLLVIGAIAAWPIYQSPAFLILVAVAAVLALVIAFVAFVRAWSWLTTTLVTLAVFLLAGVPIAVPSQLGGPAALAAGWLELVRSAVFGWKQLATISLPVGTYQGLLVPALMVFLAGGVAALRFAWSRGRTFYLALPVLLGVQLFGLAFGSSSVDVVSVPFVSSLTISRQLVIGLASFLVAMAFLMWRVYERRRSALALSQRAAGVRQSRIGLGTLVRRIVLAALIAVIAIAASIGVTPAFSVDRPREVLRTSIDPLVNIDQYTSPLAQYRSFFTDAKYDSKLLEVKGVGSGTAASTRVRLAVMSYYDGQVFRVTNPASRGVSPASAFVRVPSSLQPPGDPGTPTTVDVTIDGYSGVWLPTVGSLTSIDFTGKRSQSLTDGFFYNQPSAAGVDLAKVTAGDSYTVSADVTTASTDISALKTPSQPVGLVKPSLIPKSLTTWVQAQNAGGGGAALATLIGDLRDRGYLSHAILPNPGTPAKWVTDSGATFQSSFAGESDDRIGQMFTALTAKQNSVTADDTDQNLVAAVGDDEQFSVASALIAESLGFPARVVLGFSLDGSSTKADDIPACSDGVCFGKNLTAWIEVQGSDGGWYPVDVTPQHTNPLSPIEQHQQDPQNLTDVVPKNASEQQPPAANPTGNDKQKHHDNSTGVDLGWLVTTLKIVGISLLALLILVAPFVAILVAKARRRSGRMKAATAEDRIVGGWDEYVDAALDHGKAAPGSETRTELARSYGTPRGVVLATIADRAVFAELAPVELQSDQFWELVEAERQHFARDLTRWQRLRAALSLRSFVYYLMPAVRKSGGSVSVQLGSGGLR